MFTLKIYFKKANENINYIDNFSFNKNNVTGLIQNEQILEIKI